MFAVFHPVGREPEHFARAIARADRDVEGLAALHRVDVELAGEMGAPVVDDVGVVKARADRADGIEVRGADRLGIRRPGATNQGCLNSQRSILCTPNTPRPTPTSRSG